MPQRAESLAEVDIEIIGRWIDQGSPWSQVAVSNSPPVIYPWLYQGKRRFDLLIKHSPGWFAGTGIVLFILSLQLIIRRRGNQKAATFRLACFPISWTLIVLLLLVLGGTRSFYRGVGHDETVAWKQRIQAQFGQNTDFGHHLRNQVPKAVRRRHPPRMGGRYYRGNDERDPLLFNHGFYLTATLDLSLKNSSGTKLEWGDRVEDSPSIELVITKAPGASPSLFTDRVMERVFLTRQWIPIGSKPLLTTPPVTLRQITPGQQWKAKIQVTLSDNRSRLNGDIYVYLGKIEDQRVERASVRYGVHYYLEIQNGTISRSSEIWLESLSTMRTIQYPSEGMIPLSEWLDFWPMPVILGSNSTDSKLIGITDYPELESPR